jgi:hypothetical protein
VLAVAEAPAAVGAVDAESIVDALFSPRHATSTAAIANAATREMLMLR